MDIVRRKLTLVTSIETLNTSTSTSKNETTLARKADKESTKILFRAWLITYNGYETRKITFSCVLSDHHRLCSLSNRRRQVILSGSSKQEMETIVFVFVFLAAAFIIVVLTVVLRTCFSQIIPVDMFAKTLEKNHCSTIPWFVVPAAQIKIRFESINSIVGQVSNTCPRKYSLQRLWVSR